METLLVDEADVRTTTLEFIAKTDAARAKLRKVMSHIKKTPEEGCEKLFMTFSRLTYMLRYMLKNAYKVVTPESLSATAVENLARGTYFVKTSIAERSQFKPPKFNFIYRYDPDNFREDTSAQYKNAVQMSATAFHISSLMLDVLKKVLNRCGSDVKPNLTKAIRCLWKKMVATVNPQLVSK